MTAPRPETFRPKATRAEIMKVRGKLLDWLEEQCQPVYMAGSRVLRGLDSALIGATPNPKVIEMLAADVAELERALAHHRNAVCG